MGSKRILKGLALTVALMAVGCLCAGMPKFKVIEKVSEPKYMPRSDKAWERSCRLVGNLQKPPEKFIIKYFAPGTKIGEAPTKEKLLYTDEFSGSLTVYESRWLPPGKYDLQISAEGFEDYNMLRNIELKAGNDCLLDINFGTTEYTKSR